MSRYSPEGIFQFCSTEGTSVIVLIVFLYSCCSGSEVLAILGFRVVQISNLFREVVSLEDNYYSRGYRVLKSSGLGSRVKRMLFQGLRFQGCADMFGRQRLQELGFKV